jgi:hypothetical protein
MEQGKEDRRVTATDLNGQEDPDPAYRRGPRGRIAVARILRRGDRHF